MEDLQCQGRGPDPTGLKVRTWTDGDICHAFGGKDHRDQYSEYVDDAFHFQDEKTIRHSSAACSILYRSHQ
jgi:hypothetical protein